VGAAAASLAKEGPKVALPEEEDTSMMRAVGAGTPRSSPAGPMIVAQAPTPAPAAVEEGQAEAEESASPRPIVVAALILAVAALVGLFVGVVLKLVMER
jgi:hypothetical protein